MQTDGFSASCITTVLDIIDQLRSIICTTFVAARQNAGRKGEVSVQALPLGVPLYMPTFQSKGCKTPASEAVGASLELLQFCKYQELSTHVD